jgi:hypothetical protein
MAKQRKKPPTKNKISTPTPNPLKLTLPARPKTTETAATSQVAVEADRQMDREPANPASQLVPASALLFSQPVTAAPAIPVPQPTAAPSLPVLQAAAATPVVTKLAGLASALKHIHDEKMDQDIEILAAAATAVPYYPESPPGSKLLEDFFTLDDSQDESEILIRPTQKAKQTKKSQEKAEQEEKAQRK